MQEFLSAGQELFLAPCSAQQPNSLSFSVLCLEAGSIRKEMAALEIAPLFP